MYAASADRDPEFEGVFFAAVRTTGVYCRPGCPARMPKREYFAGHRFEFDTPLSLRGTPFQREVWTQLRTVPYGGRRSYQDVARTLGRPKALRAVGHANGDNPVAILVPCHRLLRTDGSLSGYGGGLWRKRALLDHEAAHRSPLAVAAPEVGAVFGAVRRNPRSENIVLS